MLIKVNEATCKYVVTHKSVSVIARGWGYFFSGGAGGWGASSTYSTRCLVMLQIRLFDFSEYVSRK